MPSYYFPGHSDYVFFTQVPDECEGYANQNPGYVFTFPNNFSYQSPNPEKNITRRQRVVDDLYAQIVIVFNALQEGTVAPITLELNLTTHIIYVIRFVPGDYGTRETAVVQLEGIEEFFGEV